MRCRMRCGDIWRCGGPIKKHVPVESVSIGDWDSSITFEGQLEPYDVTYSINVSPEDASNKDVTITTSDASVISVVSYDSTSVTFSIAGSGNATVTVVSQDNADILATYSVEVTPAETPFSPNNNILVEPTRGNARVKFFPVDENDENYVYGEVSGARNLVSVAYYGNCDNELCRELFSNSSLKKELARQISNYIDYYGIPASGALEFSPETWAAFESYFNGEVDASYVRMAVREGELKPADSCPVTISSIATDEVAVQFGGTATIDFTVSYDCAAPDYSNLYARSDNTAVCSVEIREADGYLKVFSHANYGECTLTFGDGTTEYTIPVTVPRPALESITIDTGGTTEIEIGDTANFSVNLFPEGATANIVPYGMYTEGVDANVTYTDGSGLVVEALAISNIEVGVEDTITGIQSGAVELSLVEAEPSIAFDECGEWTPEGDCADPSAGVAYMDYYPCLDVEGSDCRWGNDGPVPGNFGYIGYTLHGIGSGSVELSVANVVEGLDENAFSLTTTDDGDDHYTVVIEYMGDFCSELSIDPETGEIGEIGTLSAMYYPGGEEEGTEIGTVSLIVTDLWGCDGGDTLGLTNRIVYEDDPLDWQRGILKLFYDQGTESSVNIPIIDRGHVAGPVEFTGDFFDNEMMNRVFNESGLHLDQAIVSSWSRGELTNDVECKFSEDFFPHFEALYQNFTDSQIAGFIAVWDSIDQQTVVVDAPFPFYLYADLCGVTNKPTLDESERIGMASFNITVEQNDPLYEDIINDPYSNVYTYWLDEDIEADCSLPQLERNEYNEAFFPYTVVSENEIHSTIVFEFSDGRQQYWNVNITENASNAIGAAFLEQHNPWEIQAYAERLTPGGDRERIPLNTDLGRTYECWLYKNEDGELIFYANASNEYPYESYEYRIEFGTDDMTGNPTMNLVQISANAQCYM